MKKMKTKKQDLLQELEKVVLEGILIRRVSTFIEESSIHNMKKILTHQVCKDQITSSKRHLMVI